MATTIDPDQNASGLLQSRPDPLRYDGQSDHPREVAGMMQAAMPAGVKVLDVGCGTGSVTLIANKGKGNDVTCVEPDKDRADAARARGLTVFNQVLDADFLLRTGPFDIVVFADVLEHLPSPGALLSLAASGLRPGGLVIASVPNVAHWTVRLNLLFGRFDYADCGIYDSTHLRWFTERSFRALFENAALELVSIAQSSGCELGVYGNRTPFRQIPKRLKNPALRALTSALPLMFGCQHVIVARK